MLNALALLLALRFSGEVAWHVQLSSLPGIEPFLITSLSDPAAIISQVAFRTPGHLPSNAYSAEP